MELTRKQKEYYRAILERNVEYLKRGAKSSNVRCRHAVAQIDLLWCVVVGAVVAQHCDGAAQML